MKKIGMIFSGYRSESVGMGKDLYDHYRIIQERFEEAANCLDTTFLKLCFASSDITIRKVHNAYLSLFVIQSSIVDLLRASGVEPSLVAGVDVGEYSAIYAAGGLSFADALYLINKYALAYESLITDEKYAQMLVTGCSREVVEAECANATFGDQFVTVSVYHSASRFILSGTIEAIDKVKILLKKQKATIKKLRLGSGFHSFAMDAIVKSIKMHLEKIDLKSTRIPFVSGAIGQTLTEGEVVLASLMQHIHAPSHFDAVVTAFEDCDVIVQVGPGDWLVPLFQASLPSKKYYIVKDFSDAQLCIKELGVQMAPANNA